MHSILALKLYGMVKIGIIKSNAKFWRDYFDKDKVENFNIDLDIWEKELQEKNICLVCIFDNEFPKANLKLKQSEMPFLLAYKGNIDLLKDIDRNVAVIGVLNPTEEIIKREEKIVKNFAENKITIVSGLASGCDTVAHKTCLDCNGKTVAILPTTLENIYPKANIELANKIVQSNGLIITEYVYEPQNKFGKIKRFIDRDRLQAMFSKAVVLIASFTQGNGDSGSRHAMQKAKEYGRSRFVMFDKTTDNVNSILELNKEQIADGAQILTSKSIKELSPK